MKKPRTTPTWKEAQFAKEYVKRKGNGAKAALSVYDVKKANARSLAKQLIRKPIIQQEIKRIMSDAGLTLDTAGDSLKRIISNGTNSDKVTASDALRGLDMVFKLYNAYPASRSIKLSYNRTDVTASKDLQATVDDLKRITERSNSLLSSTD